MHHGESGAADRSVGLTDTPSPSHGVGDHHTDLDAERAGQGSSQCTRARIGILRQQREFGAIDVRSVDPRGGLHDAESILGDEGPALSGDDTDGLAVDEQTTSSVPRFGIDRCIDEAALHLGDDLARHHQDVVGANPRGACGDGGGEIVPGTELGEPHNGEQFDARARCVIGRHRRAHRFRPTDRKAAAAISAVASVSVINNGALTTSTPGMVASSVE